MRLRILLKSLVSHNVGNAQSRLEEVEEIEKLVKFDPETCREIGIEEE
jgi:hypothetical protein